MPLSWPGLPTLPRLELHPCPPLVSLTYLHHEHVHLVVFAAGADPLLQQSHCIDAAVPTEYSELLQGLSSLVLHEHEALRLSGCQRELHIINGEPTDTDSLILVTIFC